MFVVHRRHRLFMIVVTSLLPASCVNGTLVGHGYWFSSLSDVCVVPVLTFAAGDHIVALLRFKLSCLARASQGSNFYSKWFWFLQVASSCECLLFVPHYPKIAVQILVLVVALSSIIGVLEMLPLLVSV